MGVITFGGLASGMDTAAIINGLMQLERLPIQRIETRITAEQRGLTLFQTLNTRLGEISTRSAAIQSRTELDARTTTSSNEDILTAEADSDAVVGSFRVEVTQLARHESISSTVSWAATSTAIGTTGDLVVNGETVSLLNTDSIQTVVNKINDADAGVSATVVQVAAGDFRISLVSEEAGAAGITLTNGGAPDMVGTVLGLTQVDQEGLDAIIEVNGLQITRNSNTISDAVEGVTLNLQGEGAGEVVTIDIARDTETIKTAITDFVNALNSARQFLLDNTQYNSTTKTGGALMGDSAARSVQSRLMELAQSTVPAMQTARLSTLNDGAGVVSGSIDITDRNGGNAVIDLTNAYTVQDVLDAINGNNDIEITASVNAGGTAIVLTDTSEGAGSITVAESGSTTAAGLGILGSSAEETLVGSDVGDGIQIAFATIGIRTNKTGLLEIDEEELDEALESNFGAVVSLLTTSETGLGNKAEDMMDLLTDPIDGIVKARQDSVNARIERMRDQIERMEDRLEKRETSLTRQFSVLEQSVSQYQSMGTFLSNQLAGFQSMNS